MVPSVNETDPLVSSVAVTLVTARVCPLSFGGPAVSFAKSSVAANVSGDAHDVAGVGLQSSFICLKSSAGTGGSLTSVTVIVNVCAALVSTPLLATPPVSCTVTWIVATPFASGADWKVSVPSLATAGALENSDGL